MKEVFHTWTKWISPAESTRFVYTFILPLKKSHWHIQFSRMCGEVDSWMSLCSLFSFSATCFHPNSYLSGIGNRQFPSVNTIVRSGEKLWEFLLGISQMFFIIFISTHKSKDSIKFTFPNSDSSHLYPLYGKDVYYCIQP